MSQVGVLHDKAMGLAQLAMIARQQGEYAKSETLAREACDHEMKAAELIPAEATSEPTRSILFRSAASLAYQAKDFPLALRLIGKGLAGYTPERIRNEMIQLLDAVKFESYLERNQTSLTNEDFQLIMDGNAVGLGVVPYNEFFQRIKNIPGLISKTVQRLMKRPYSSSGRMPDIYKRINPAICALQSGSFSITIKLTIAKGQMHQAEVTCAPPEKVIDELLMGFEYINNSDIDGLKEHIKDEAYFNHFLYAAKDMAPDGNHISYLGLVSSRKSVMFTKPHNEISIPATAIVESPTMDQLPEVKPIDVIGLLDVAFSRKKEYIELTSEEGHTYKVIVSQGMEELVRSYFKQFVRVTGIYDGEAIHSADIQPAE